MREKISACIIAGNEENNIRRCLESIRWADEIVVVDSFSRDRTAEICREYTELVYSHRWLGYIAQKNLIKELASGPWILFIDADEEISPKLQEEIVHEFETGASLRYAGYEFPRIVYYLGRWIRYGSWYPDIKLRLFRKNKGKCGGHEPHDRTTVEGPVKRLKGRIHHFTYDNIRDQISTLNRFSSISADGYYSEKRTFRLVDLMFRPLFRFLRGYFLKGGFLNGIAGLVIEATTAYGVFIKYAKLWEKHLRGKSVTK